MSSSKPKTTLFLSDELDVTAKDKKIFFRRSVHIGRASSFGRNPDIDVAYQYSDVFLQEDDNALQELYQGYKSGKILAGEMKQICIDRASEWLKELKEKRMKQPT